VTTQITLELPDHLYERAQELAAQQRQDVAGVITDLLNEALAVEGQMSGYTGPDAAVQREIDAYLEMYPRLVNDYLGKNVAMFHGKLVDHDEDFGALMKRIEAQYPDDFVLVKRVDSVPIRTITVRSPRYTAGG
jgi:hypothetical protein